MNFYISSAALEKKQKEIKYPNNVKEVLKSKSSGKGRLILAVHLKASQQFRGRDYVIHIMSEKSASGLKSINNCMFDANINIGSQ